MPGVCGGFVMMLGGLLQAHSLQEMAGLGTLSSPWEPDALGTEQCTLGSKYHSRSVPELRCSQEPLLPRLIGTSLLSISRVKEMTGLIPLWFNKG